MFYRFLLEMLFIFVVGIGGSSEIQIIRSLFNFFFLLLACLLVNDDEIDFSFLFSCILVSGPRKIRFTIYFSFFFSWILISFLFGEIFDCRMIHLTLSVATNCEASRLSKSPPKKDRASSLSTVVGFINKLPGKPR